MDDLLCIRFRSIVTSYLAGNILARLVLRWYDK